MPSETQTGHPSIILEICAGSVGSAVAAQQGGADRIELCDNLDQGGTTPSLGTIRLTRQQLNILVFPLIRPRAGDFLYDDLEFRVMQQDIRTCKEEGCDGIVIGILTPEGKVDRERVSRLVELAWPMEVTFHRAFDLVCDPFQALEEVILAGCQRILTSGGRRTAPEGAELLGRLVRESGGRITIMPGSGIRENNIASLVQATGAREFHSSAKVVRPGGMVYKNSEDPFGSGEGEFSLAVTDAAQVRRLRLRAETALP